MLETLNAIQPAFQTASFPEMRAYICRMPKAEAWIEPAAIPADRLEILLCMTGSLTLERENDALIVRPREMLLLSGRVKVETLQVSPDGFSGILVTADLSADMKPIWHETEGIFAWKPAQIHDYLAQYHGAVVLRGQPWLGACFAALSQLHPEQQLPYSILKVAELFFLLCCGGLTPPVKAGEIYYDEYQQSAVRCVEEYMLAHLGEHMTIPELAEQFRISPTLLKNCFRQLYGEPVHSYLRRKRLEQAAELLKTSSLSVLQIANQVGYGSVSQFGAAFKQYFHAAPFQYRRSTRYKNI